MSCLKPIFKREIKSYFGTPVAYVFIVIFLFLTGLFTFQVANILDANEARLDSFFQWHPWLYLFLIPAIGMRLWAEERRSGTIELLLTLPTGIAQAVIAKFMAAWVFVGIALSLTFPVVLTVMDLGDVDGGVIIGGYIGSFLMAGAYLSIGTCMSALTKNQVVSFILAVVVCLMLVLAGFPAVIEVFSGWSPVLADAISQVSFLTHFMSISKGAILLTDVVFFLSLIVGFLGATVVVLEAKKAK